jgi:hypothetical protein
MQPSYKREPIHRKENRPDADLTIRDLIGRLRSAYLQDRADTYGFTVERDICTAMGLPSRVWIVVSMNTDLFNPYLFPEG